MFGIGTTSNVLLFPHLAPPVLTPYGGREDCCRTRQMLLCVTAFVVGLTPLVYVPPRMFGDGFVLDFVFLSGHKLLSLHW